jgi:hypothetical protein
VKLFDGADGSGVLDYVCGWYVKAAKYIQGTRIKVGFVSTNSIVQGEQTAILWGSMLHKYKVKIHFAHRTFKWSNEARGNAAVHCVIIGFATIDPKFRTLYFYEAVDDEPHQIIAKNINPYLVDGKDILISKRGNPLCSVPRISKGNQPTDGGFLILNKEDVDFLLKHHPDSEKYIRTLIGAEEFINGNQRWCLWLVGVSPNEIKGIPFIYDRVNNVRAHRLKSSKLGTVRKAETPSLFDEIRQPQNDYLVIPEITSERRKYIPIGFLDKEIIVTNKVQIIPEGALYHFGVLTSIMHMAWVKYVCGRLESRFIYSASIVYNNYPWPENPSEKQTKAIETAAQAVLEARAQFPNSSLADLYDPLTMPPALVKAHNELDKAVDLAYRPQPFTSEAQRMEFLFALYESYTADLFTKEKQKKARKKPGPAE